MAGMPRGRLKAVAPVPISRDDDGYPPLAHLKRLDKAGEEKYKLHELGMVESGYTLFLTCTWFSTLTAPVILIESRMFVRGKTTFFHKRGRRT
jgi:hypothetical protein